MGFLTAIALAALPMLLLLREMVAPRRLERLTAHIVCHRQAALLGTDPRSIVVEDESISPALQRAMEVITNSLIQARMAGEPVESSLALLATTISNTERAMRQRLRLASLIAARFSLAAIVLWFGRAFLDTSLGIRLSEPPLDKAFKALAPFAFLAPLTIVWRAIPSAWSWNPRQGFSSEGIEWVTTCVRLAPPNATIAPEIAREMSELVDREWASGVTLATEKTACVERWAERRHATNLAAFERAEEWLPVWELAILGVTGALLLTGPIIATLGGGS